MTLSEFANVFAPLAIQLRQTDADEATIRCYYEAMKDLEIEFVAMAAVRLAKESDWFPKTSEWRTMAATIERERVEAHALLHGCASCGGSGWLMVGPGTTAGGGFAAERVQQCPCAKLQRQRLLESMRRCEELERADAIRENA